MSLSTLLLEVISSSSSSSSHQQQITLVSRLRYLRAQYQQQGQWEKAVETGRRILQWNNQVDDQRHFLNCCQKAVRFHILSNHHSFHE